MTIAVQCTSCGKQFKAKAEHAGKRARCPACATVLTIPTPSAPSAVASLGDLLDEELRVSAAAAAPAAAEARPKARKCRQCGDELIEGSHYCMACGHNNRDVAGAVANTALNYDKRQQKLEAAARPRHWLVAWFLRGWFH